MTYNPVRHHGALPRPLTVQCPPFRVTLDQVKEALKGAPYAYPQADESLDSIRLINARMDAIEARNSNIATRRTEDSADYADAGRQITHLLAGLGIYPVAAMKDLAG